MTARIRKGDLVLVRSGDDAGKRGRVLRVLPADDRAVVEGVNVVFKHLRRSQKNPRGGRVEKEAPVPLSRLMLIDPSTEPQAITKRGEGIWRHFVARNADSVASVAVLAAANAVIAAVRAEYRSHSYMALQQEFRAFPGVGLDPAVRESVRRTLAQLGIVAAFLLCLAIANLANLTLIESTRRGTITAIRVSLGASRVRIARGVFVETALLAVCALASCSSARVGSEVVMDGSVR